MTAEQLTDYVWVVGRPEPGPAHTSPYDCVQYLLWDGHTGILVDTGTGLGIDRLRHNVATVCPSGSLAVVLLTHYHGDHAGGVAGVGSLGAPVYTSATTAAAVEAADEQVTQVARARSVGVYPSEFRLAAPSDVALVTATDPVQLGSFTVTPVSAEGHCDGHVVFLVEVDSTQMLFSGDALFAGGRISMQAIPDCRLDVYADTVARVAELDIDQLFPGHGEPVFSGAAEDIGRAAQSFARLVPPPNFLS